LARTALYSAFPGEALAASRLPREVERPGQAQIQYDPKGLP